MSTLADVIAAVNTGDPDVSADAVLATLGVPAKWREVFRPLVRDECRRSYRADVRLAENAPVGHGDGAFQSGNADGGATSRKSYLDERFYNGTVYVLWGEATVEDHRNRIAYLASLRNGINETIDKHAAAVEAIESAGASCLNDLPQEVAA